MKFTTIFFDLDDTLYSASTGLWTAVRNRIALYMQQEMGIPEEQVPRLRREYFEKYGTTLRGLELHHHVNRLEFLAYVHDLPLSEYIAPNPALRSMLLAIPTRRVIFTNADVPHALRVTRQLGIEDCFERIVDINTTHPDCKPMRPAFETALRLSGESDPRRCIMLDDAPRTTRAAREIGMFSILVSEHPPVNPADADACLPNIHDLPNLLLKI